MRSTRGRERAGGGRAGRFVPWVVSGLLHAVLVTLACLGTWTVQRPRGDASPRITPSIAVLPVPIPPPSPAPLPPTDPPSAPVVAAPVVEPPPSPPPLASKPASQPVPLETRRAAPRSPDPPTPTPPSPPPPPRAAFAGLTGTEAVRVVYVIDASGSMIAVLPTVLAHLRRSLDALDERQSFAIIFFQAQRAQSVPPGELVGATGANRRAALAWIEDEVHPGGGSHPGAALEAGLAMRPDVLFLLSDAIAGSGPFAIDPADLLARLDHLNPIDLGTGRRPTRIRCVQFLDPDPLDTLRRIAEAHSGDDGYTYLDRAELGFVSP